MATPQQLRVAVLVLVASLVLYTLWRQRQRRAGYLTLFDKLCNTFYLARELLAVSSNVGLALKDTRAFLSSDTDQLPAYVTQCYKMLASPMAGQVVENFVRSVSSGCTSKDGLGVVDKLLEAACSPRGQDFISFVVCNATGKATDIMVNKVLEACEGASSSERCMLNTTLQWLGSVRGQAVVTSAVTAFVRHGVEVYCNKTAGANTYDDLLQSISRPEHLRTAQVLTHTFCSTTVDAVLRQRTAAGGLTPLSPKRRQASSLQRADVFGDPAERIPLSMRADIENIENFDVDVETAQMVEASDRREGASSGDSQGTVTGVIIALSQVPEIRSLVPGVVYAGASGIAEALVKTCMGELGHTLRTPSQAIVFLYILVMIMLLLLMHTLAPCLDVR